MHMRNVGHGSHGPKSFATDHTDEDVCHGSHGPKIFATDRTDRSPVATDHTDHTDQTVSLSNPWPIDSRSVAFRVVRGLLPRIARTNDLCHGSHRPKPCCHGSHRSHGPNRLSLKPVADRSPVRGFRVVRGLLPR